MPPVATAEATESRTRDRRDARRETIVTAAGQLFSARGFHAVSLDDIGERCGMTGPALYRYFASKQDILFAVMTRFDAVFEVAELQAGDAAPLEAVEALVHSAVSMVVDDHGFLPVLWIRDRHNLIDDHRRLIRERQRRHLEHWVRALSRLRPELSYAAARTLVQSAIGVVASAALFPAQIDEAQLKDVLLRQAVALLVDDHSVE